MTKNQGEKTTIPYKNQTANHYTNKTTTES